MGPQAAGRGLLARLRSDSPSDALPEVAAIALHLEELLNAKDLLDLETSPLGGLMQSCPQRRLAWQHRLQGLLMRYEQRLCQLQLRCGSAAPPSPLSLHIIAQRRGSPAKKLHFIATLSPQGRFILSKHNNDATS